MDPFDWSGEDEPDSPYAGQSPSGYDEAYPDINSVPEAPTEGLVADTRNRLYREVGEGALAQQDVVDSQIMGEPVPAPVEPVIAQGDMMVSLESEMESAAPPVQAPLQADVSEAGTLPEIIESDAVTAESSPRSTSSITVKTGVLFFPFASSYVEPADRRYVREIARQAKEKNATLRVVGHASSFTRDMSPFEHNIANFRASLERARAVANLILDSGFSGDKLDIEARSDSEPLFLEVMPAGRRGNQRVELFMEY